MRNILWFIVCLPTGLFGGFLGDTLVKTLTGYIEIGHLKQNDAVISYDYNGHYAEGRVKNIFKSSEDYSVCLTVGSAHKLMVSAPQRFYAIEVEGLWVSAYALKKPLIALLKGCGNEVVFVTRVEDFAQDKDGEAKHLFYDLEIDEYHNYYVSRADVLAEDAH